MARTLVVLGMHRSGTSALTEALVEAGAWFGPPAIATPANDENPRGFFERRDVRRLTDQAMEQTGCSWHDLHRFEAVWKHAPARDLRAEFQQTVGADLGAHPVSVVKDPRLCLLMPLFAEAITNPIAVYIIRDPAEVALSLQTRNRFPRLLSLALWEVYNRHALTAMRRMPWVRVRYEQLVADPKAAMTTLIAQLKALGVDGLDAEKGARSGVIDPALHRQHAPPADMRRLGNGEQQTLWKRVSGAQLDLTPFGKAAISLGAREVLAWHHALNAAVTTLPYMVRPIPQAGADG